MINIGSRIICIDNKGHEANLVLGKEYTALAFESCKCGLNVFVGITEDKSPLSKGFNKKANKTYCSTCNVDYLSMYFKVNRFAEVETFHSEEVNELMKEVNEKKPFEV